MIAEFEQRLADVLGERLAEPFAGRVRVAGADPPPGNETRFIVALSGIEPQEPELGDKRPEIVPGAPDPRRVLRLVCTVEVRPVAELRGEWMLGLDAALFALGAPDFQTGEVFRGGPADPGFLIQQMEFATGTAPIDPAADAPPFGLTFRAEGWFWPVNQVGQAGVAIGEIQFRGVAMPIEISPARPQLVAGGPAVEFRVSIRAAGVQRIADKPAPPLEFGLLVFALAGPGGKPGAGELSGGNGSNGVRLVALDRDPVTHEFQPVAVTYTPPAQAASDELILGFEDGTGGLGIEIGRFPLRVRET